MASQKRFLLVAALMIVGLTAFTPLVQAEAILPTGVTPVTINLDVEGPSSTLFNGPVIVSACLTPDNATTTINGYCAFADAVPPLVVAEASPSGPVNSINGIAGNWQWSLNGTPQTGNIADLVLNGGENIVWSLPTTPPPSAPTTTPPDQITLTIRGNNTTAFSGTVPLSASGTPDLSVTTTDGTTTATVSPRSLLGVLEFLEASSTSFNISKLLFFPPFDPSEPGSFYVKCIAVPSGTSTPDCNNWTDAVDGAYPSVGMDHQLLKNGDVVYVFFGSQKQAVLSANSVAAGQPFTATAEQYDLSSGTYKPLAGVILGVGTPNPDFSFTEIATSTVDVSGQATFTVNATGTFAVGIQPDYFPTAPITITDAVTTPPAGGGGSVPVVFNVPNALAFIAHGQNADGSFGSDIVTDWTAVAFGAADPGAAKTKLHDYLAAAKPAMSSITDYERHAMALEALGISPFNGTPVDYITPIVNSFDGTQIGDPSLDNDDIFSIFPLTFAGYASWFKDPAADPYASSNPILQKEVKYIISTQKPDGSWDDSVDLTAAAIQALGPYTAPFPTNPEAQPAQVAIGNAIGYLVTSQQDAGGWGTGSATNIDSTSWVQTMINSIPPNHSFLPAFKSKTSHLPTDAIVAAQQPDGGVLSSGSRVWSTGYAVTAASGQSWLSVLKPFSKPLVVDNSGSVIKISTSTATSTLGALNPVTPTSTSASAATTTPIITITLPLPVIAAPTTTLPHQTAPKIKVRKLLVKKPALEPAPQVLGAATTAPSPMPGDQPQSPPAPASHPGFWGSLWHALASFFGHLF